MMILWGLRGYHYTSVAELRFTLGNILAIIGCTLMVVSMLRIYTFNRSKRLVTSDIFALTRHPMYHGMFIADAATFFYITEFADPLFWASWLAFVALLVAAGWHQEKETLTRWGIEAESYYAKTPRFIFGWLFKRS